MNSHTKWQTVQIQISWLLQKFTVCKGRVYPGSAGQGLKAHIELKLQSKKGEMYISYLKAENCSVKKTKKKKKENG